MPDSTRQALMRLVVVLLINASVVAARSWNAFAHPLLFCEDGTMLFLFASGWGFENVFRHYNGYMAVGYHLAAYLASRLPLVDVPYGMAAYCLVVAAATHGILVLRRFRFLIPHDAVRCVTAVLLTALPIGNVFLVSTARCRSAISFGCLRCCAWHPSPRALLCGERSSR